MNKKNSGKQEISLISLELENYRQYYGKQLVEFQTRDDGFTTIVGENGEGKSNLLNAMNWCFYKNEPHGKKDPKTKKPFGTVAPIVNTSYIKELKSETTGKVSVRVNLKVGDTTYSIYRNQTILVHKLEYEKTSGGLEIMKYREFEHEDKVPAGCELVQNMSGLNIEQKGKDDLDFHPLDNTKFDTVINQILPKSLSVFFLLDGEFLEKFWDDFKKVETGIRQILQLHLLADAKDHVGIMNARRISLGDGSKEQMLQDDITRNEHHKKSLNDDGLPFNSEQPRWSQHGKEESTEMYPASGEPRVSAFEEDRTKMEKRQVEIGNELGDVSATGTKALAEKRKLIAESHAMAKGNKNNCLKTWNHNLIFDAPLAFLKDAMEKSVKIIDERQELGDLPNEEKHFFTNVLLERGFCICHTDLNSKKSGDTETNKARVEVEKERDKLSVDVGLDVSLKMRIAFQGRVLDNYNGFLDKTFGTPKENFRIAEKAEDKLNEEKKKIMKEMGDTGNDETKDLINESTRLTEQITTATEKIVEEKRKLVDWKKESYQKKQEVSKLMGTGRRKNKQYHQMKVWDRAESLLDKAHEELKDDIRTDVQERTWEIFSKLFKRSTDEDVGGLKADEEFTAFEIESNYDVILQTSELQNHIYNLSAGQSLFLAISFVTALRGITGYTFPFVIDTPLGKVSGTQRYNLAKALPTYLEGEQLTLLATDTEWLPENPNISGTPRDEGSVADLIEEKVDVKYYRIRKIRDKATIKRSKHVKDDSGRGTLEYV